MSNPARPIALACWLLAAISPGAEAWASQRGSYLGVWAGERMNCDWPAARLHRWQSGRMRSPAQYQDSTAEDCVIRARRGASHEWVFELQCRSSGRTEPTLHYRATRSVTLLDARRVRIVTRTTQDAEPIEEEWLLCRRWRSIAPASSEGRR